MPVIKTKMTKYDKLLVEGKVAMREIFEAAAQGDAFYSRAANRIKHAQSHRSTGMSLDDFAVAWAKHGCATIGAALEQSRFMSEGELSSLHNQTLMPPPVPHHRDRRERHRSGLLYRVYEYLQGLSGPLWVGPKQDCDKGVIP